MRWDTDAHVWALVRGHIVTDVTVAATSTSLSGISYFIASGCITSSSNRHASPCFFFFRPNLFQLGILEVEELTHFVGALLVPLYHHGFPDNTTCERHASPWRFFSYGSFPCINGPSALIYERLKRPTAPKLC